MIAGQLGVDSAGTIGLCGGNEVNNLAGQSFHGRFRVVWRYYNGTYEVVNTLG
jgi:hypothetical protein